jgi:hypothetical protein
LNVLFDAETTCLIVLRAGNFILIVKLLALLSSFAYDLHSAEK